MLWSRNNKTPENDPSRKIDPALKERFRQAVWGSQFRSREFRGPQTTESFDTEWLEAFYTVTRGWIVKQKTRFKHKFNNAPHIHSSDEPSVGEHTLHQDLTFFEAIEIVANYESTHPDEGFALCESPSLEDLGERHYLAFGEREGLAFDTNGLPHPTDQGYIVTDGHFAENATDKSRAAYLKKSQPIHRALPESVLPKMEAGIEHVFDEEIHKLRALIALVKKVNTTAQQGVDKGMLKDSRMSFDSIVTYHSLLSKRTRQLQKTYDKLITQGNFAKLDNAAGFLHEVNRAIQLFLHHIYKITAISLHQELEKDAGAKNKLDDAIENARNTLTSIGYPSECEQSIRRDVLAAKRCDYPGEADDIIVWFETLIDNLKAASGIGKRRKTTKLPEPMP